MRNNRAARVVKMLAIAVVAIPLFGLLVMSLWNWLMPAVFNVRPVSFGQALGLFFLSRILFGRFGGGAGGRGPWNREMRQRWARMTPEERERFRAGMQEWCGRSGREPHDAPESSPASPFSPGSST
jgi:hypothetical protein